MSEKNIFDEFLALEFKWISKDFILIPLAEALIIKSQF